MKTDGYITDAPGSSYWAYGNTRDGAGAGASPTGDAWARCERAGGPIAGTLVDAGGNVSTSGPTVAFTSATALVNSVGGPGGSVADPNNIWIQWAGVSPQSLREVLIVWSQNIVLMDVGKIRKTGGPGEIEAIRIEGRLMVIAMTAPIAITGSQQFVFTMDAGAVGFYGSKPAGDYCIQPPINTGGSGELEPLPDPSVCSSFRDYNEGGGSGGSGGTPVTEPLLFCNQCAAGDPPEPVQPTNTSTTAFAVCRGFASVPVRCTHPFVLVELKVCGGGDCEAKCPVWLVCYHLTGTSIPVQVFGLDTLRDIDPCNINSSEIYGTTTEDAQCGDQPHVHIAVLSGPTVSVSGYWSDTLPGYAGQSVNFQYKCYSACGNTCVSKVTPDQAQQWVTEDLIKPTMRTIPVLAFSGQGLKSIPHTWLQDTSTHTIREILFSNAGNFVTDVTPSNTPACNVILSHTPDPLNFLTGSVGGGLVVHVGTLPIDICVGGSVVTVNVVTSVTTVPVTVTPRAYDILTYEFCPIGVMTTLSAPIAPAITFIATGDNTFAVPLPHPDPIFLLVPDTSLEPPLKFLTFTSNQSDGIKLMQKPLILQGTRRQEVPPGACAGPPGCLTFHFDAEKDDSDIEGQGVLMLSPKMVDKTPGNEAKCPCYTCDKEVVDFPSGTEVWGGGDHNPCTVSVKRLQRDWCVKCGTG